MSKARPYLYVVLALVIGFALGMRYATWFSGDAEVELRMRAQEDRIDIALRALQRLRVGTTNTSEFLEIQLDDAVIALGHLVSESPKVYRTRNGLEMIRKAKEYRDKFPHHSAEPGLDARIAQTFALARESQSN